MMRRRATSITIIGILVMFVLMTGCAEAPMFIQQALGRGIAEQREYAKNAPCPKITVFNVTPLTAKCGGEVTLDFAAASPTNDPLTYVWDIEGQTFQTGQRAVWKTPGSDIIGDPEKTFTVRGVVSDGQCSITQSAEVTVICAAAFDSMVHFEFGKADLDATARIELDRIAEELEKNPDQAVMIDGHTDFVGTEPANERLGERRAEAVRNYLIKTWKIAGDRIITRSFGEEEPIAPNDDLMGRAKNRRAEMFRILLSTRNTPDTIQEIDIPQ